MERNEISLHEVKIYEALREHPDRWLTNQEIGAYVPDVAARTIRAHTHKLAQANVVDLADVFPGHRYRWSEMAEKRNQGYALRLKAAAEVFG